MVRLDSCGEVCVYLPDSVSGRRSSVAVCLLWTEITSSRSAPTTATWRSGVAKTSNSLSGYFSLFYFTFKLFLFIESSSTLTWAHTSAI